MEPPNEKISFEKLNVGAFGNSSYNQAYSSPPECYGKQSDLNGYIQPINENGNRISSNHGYLIVQGSIKSNLSPDKEPDEPHSWLHSGKNKKKGDHCGNHKEFSDLDNCPDSVKADSNIKQQEVKLNFPQIKYVEGPLNSPENETEKALKSSRCSPGKIVAFVMITFIIMTGLGVGAYFLILRNISKDEESASSFLPSISNKTNSSTTISVTFETTIRSTEPSTYTTTNSAALLTTPTHSQEISSGTVKNLDTQLEDVYQ
ncbi:Hypothetical predicted protein [Mytilus galloprovincialis]|uniref:Uncharacterized protein n=1 Tax=Mytilus galloprovincialis TaxID=29158 RepID=A0A8B6C784_MYTGA|nr:Hypothetical predicted protein [Mytilus galloprovincialis]